MFTTLQDTLTKYFKVKPDEVTLESTLHGLGLDSLDVVEFFMFIEEDFDIEIAESEVSGDMPMSAVVALIEGKGGEA
jgi:acyl carrier protein